MQITRRDLYKATVAILRPHNRGFTSICDRTCGLAGPEELAKSLAKELARIVRQRDKTTR